jgi:rhamnulokinase
VLGRLDVSLPELADFGDVPVIAVATHDTASAVAAVPSTAEHFVYISSGTWSLMGTETRSPVITPDSLKYNFTNEGGVNGTYRLLKNILGMWLVQACQDVWDKAGRHYTYPNLIQLAAGARPFGAVIDPYPNSPDFRSADDMPERIKAFCARTAQPVPADEGEILRCIFESLALKYRQTLEQLRLVTGHDFEVIHVVGGGARNGLLCQMTADTTRRPVIAGPGEATTLGNVAVQAIATGQLGSIEEARGLIKRSSELTYYEPSASRAWDHAYARFLEIAQA